MQDSLIDSVHVSKQFSRRGNLSNAQFLYSEIAGRMGYQLQYMRIEPDLILDAGCGYGDGYLLLHKFYPKAKYIGIDNCLNLLNLAKKRFSSSFPINLIRKHYSNPQFLEKDLSKTELPPEALDLIWSNLALHWHPNPRLVFSEWRRILRVNGLVIFSSLGIGSLHELQEAVLHSNSSTSFPIFLDIHNLGDILIDVGLENPVLNQDIITLQYRSPQKLLRDIHVLGGNPIKNRRKNLTSRLWFDRLCASLEEKRERSGIIPLTIEIIYGHAWKASCYSSSKGEVKFSINSIKKKMI